MSATITKIAIAGFTGRMGRLTTAQLLRHPNVTINGICRTPSKVSSEISSNPNVRLFAAKSTDTTALRHALKGTSACICCYLGDDTLMNAGQKTLIDACVAENVPRYIASDYTIDFRGLKFGDHPAKDPMKHVQVYLKELEKENKIKGVHVLNGAFMQVIWAPFLGLVDTEKDVFQYYGTGDEKIDMTTYEDTAKFTAEVALDPKANGFLNVLGDRKSIKELAQLYQEAFGVVPKVQRKGSLDDLYGIMRPFYEKNKSNTFSWMGMFYQYYMTNGSTVLGKLDNDRYPNVKPVSARTFLERYTKENVAKAVLF